MLSILKYLHPLNTCILYVVENDKGRIFLREGSEPEKATNNYF
jgi:hypothetical protein